MKKPSVWSSWEMKARHGTLACGLGVASTVIGSWISAWIVEMVFSSPSPLIANVLGGWAWNAWLWIVFAPIAWVVARIFPIQTTSFVLMGGTCAFFFWLILHTALFGFERFSELPFYALSCLFWFITGLFWAWGFARCGEYFFRKAQEKAQAFSKANERYYVQWLSTSANTDESNIDNINTDNINTHNINTDNINANDINTDNINVGNINRGAFSAEHLAEQARQAEVVGEATEASSETEATEEAKREPEL
ncbi:MAG: hypothetical protein FWG75_07410 [Cystobacterineae bacterium]|nr:hypothetical protein [Cystobacterineae bacterium]